MKWWKSLDTYQQTEWLRRGAKVCFRISALASSFSAGIYVAQHNPVFLVVLVIASLATYAEANYTG